jgi:hypothetical protein
MHAVAAVAGGLGLAVYTFSNAVVTDLYVATNK